MKRIFLFSVLCIAAFSSCATRKTTVADESKFPEFSMKLSENIIFEIDPRIELLSGVQSATTWLTESRPNSEYNIYLNELSEYFKPYAKTLAFKLSQSFTDRGFSYDAPPGFALSLEGGTAMLAPKAGWSDYLKQRAGGKAKLDSFGKSLTALYLESAFKNFLLAHEGDYRRWLTEASKDFNAEPIAAWLAGFYGKSEFPIVYRFLLAPAMFPGGGYGFSIVRENSEGIKTLNIYQIVRAMGSADGQPGFPSGQDLAMLGLHEFGHSFVNPAVEAVSHDSRLASGLEAIFKPVRSIMDSQAYGAMPVFLNELVLRAACILAERELGILSANEAEQEIKSERRRGFYPIGRVIALLEEYQKNRAAYPDFSTYAPVLVEKLASESDAIVREGAVAGYSSANPAAIPAVDSFFEGFEGDAAGQDYPKEFSLELGATSGKGGTSSHLAFDKTDPGSGSVSYTFIADAATNYWYCLSRPVSIKNGTLTLRYKARGQAIRTEGSQFGGSYVGFIITEKSGKKRFAVAGHTGSFSWADFSLEEKINGNEVRSIDFTAFLNESGTLSIDDIAVGYR